MDSTCRHFPQPNPDALAKLEVLLERTALSLGDITEPVLLHYYSHYPDAESLFTEKAHGQKKMLEREMVGSALYCIMTLFEHPLEVDNLLANTVPHHNFLKIPPMYLIGLQHSVIAVISAVIHDDETEFKSLLKEVDQQLIGMIETAAQY